MPDFAPVPPSPSTISVECVDGPALDVEWSAELGTFDCLLPGCAAVNPMVAVGAGHYWTVAELEPPNSQGPLSSGKVAGFAVLDFDESGNAVQHLTADVRSGLQGALPYPYTRTIRADSRGTLNWASTTTDNAGIELRRYSPDGSSTEPRLVVERAVFGHAAWGTDGYSVVTYRYSPPVDGAPSEELRPGIAAFDGAGQLVWNQTLLLGFFDRDPSLHSIRETVAGVDAERRALVRLTDVHADGTEGPTRMLLLDANGNVQWAREIPNRAPSMTVFDPASALFPDGTSLVVTLGPRDASGPSPLMVDELDPSGTVSWHAVFSPMDVTDAVTFDERGRVVLSGRQFEKEGVVVLDRTGPSCTWHPFSVSKCAPAGTAPAQACGYFSLAAASGHLYFGAGTRVGLAKLP